MVYRLSPEDLLLFSEAEERETESENAMKQLRGGRTLAEMSRDEYDEYRRLHQIIIEAIRTQTELMKRC
jgi:hypothetical protein